MTKHLKYSWLIIFLIIPFFLNISKPNQDIFTVVSSADLSGVQEDLDEAPHLLQQKDERGFTLYDYAVLNQDPDVEKWIFSQKVTSGVTKDTIERVRLWFLLLGIPVNSSNFNLQGIYDKGLEDAIINYQTTRGLNKQKRITPDWYMDLEEEGTYFLQELLLEPNSEYITGSWNDESANALKRFQKDEGLPETGHLSLADIVALKKAYANTIGQKQIVQTKVDENIVGSDEVVKVTQVTIEAPDIEVITQAIDEPKSEVTPTDMTAGFLIDGHATPGKLLNLQIWLTLAGFPAGTLDGQMGPSTRQAIRDYETSIGLKPTGIMSARWETPLEKVVWSKVQEKLKQLNLYDQDVDGIPGASTVAALKSYEESVELKPSGELLPETLSMLFNEGQMMNNVPIEDFATVVVDHSEEDDIIEEENEDESTNTEDISVEESAPEEEIIGSVASFDPTGKDDVAKLQLMLAVLGFYKGEVAGEMNDDVVVAIKEFQSQNRLSADGQAGRQTMAELNKQSITRVQLYLKDKGLLKDNPTGSLGPKTRRLIADLRKSHKLPDSDPSQLDIGILIIVLGDVNNKDYVQIYLDELEKQRILKEQTQSAQEYLTALGYFNGKIDGIQGKSTNDAILKYKKASKLTANDDLDNNFFDSLRSETIKKIQQELIKLGYKIKADGMMGPTTKKTIETFQKRYSYKVTGEATLATLHQINARIAANNRRQPAAAQQQSGNDQPIKGVMPKLGAKGAQAEKVLTAAPQAISGRMSMIYNSKGVLSGCKVNNISISAAMCGSAKNNQQCRIVYRKGRVLSVSCRG